MHELDITRSIAKEASDKCKKEGVLAGEVFVELGELSSYKTEPIETFYDAIKADHETLKKSKINISLKNGKARCNKCREEFKIKDFWDIACSKCHSKDFEVIEGEDVRLLKIK